MCYELCHTLKLHFDETMLSFIVLCVRCMPEEGRGICSPTGFVTMSDEKPTTTSGTTNPCRPPRDTILLITSTFRTNERVSYTKRPSAFGLVFDNRVYFVYFVVLDELCGVLGISAMRFRSTCLIRSNAYTQRCRIMCDMECVYGYA